MNRSAYRTQPDAASGRDSKPTIWWLRISTMGCTYNCIYHRMPAFNSLSSRDNSAAAALLMIAAWHPAGLILVQPLDGNIQQQAQNRICGLAPSSLRLTTVRRSMVQPPWRSGAHHRRCPFHPADRRAKHRDAAHHTVDAGGFNSD